MLYKPFAGLRSRITHATPQDDPVVQAHPDTHLVDEHEKKTPIDCETAVVEGEPPYIIEEKPAEDVQLGVRRAQATHIIWTKKDLYILFGFMWLIYLMNALQSSITGNLTPFVVSDFSAHSLIPTMYIVSNVMAGACRLAVAKTLDLWGRPQGFAVMTAIAVAGMIMMASCNNVYTFAAAQVFYAVGFDGVIYTVDVTTADSSSLRNRGLAYAFTASPWIITTFSGPKAAEGFYENISWRWAFGMFCMMIPVIASGFFTVLKLNERKAKRAGVLPLRESSGRSLSQSLVHYLIEFDAVGIFVFAAGFVLLLLPFNLADSAPDGWQSGYIIGMIITGGILIISFVVYEHLFAPKPFLPFHLLISRTVLGTCMLGASYQVAYYCWNGYFTSYLQVVHGLTIAEAGYVGSTFDVVSGLWIFVVGFLIRYTGRFKWLFIAAVPLDILGIGLMIYFRRPDQSIGYVVMCQIFIALSGGTIILTQQVAVTAVAKQSEIAAVLALLGLFGYVGGAVGNTISGAVWTNTFPDALDKYLPEYALGNVTDIYGSLDIQLSYPKGDPVRDGIIQAYGVAQRNMCIAGTAVMVLAFIWALMIKNIDIKKTKQVVGTVL